MIDKSLELAVARLNLPSSLQQEQASSRESASALHLSRASALSKPFSEQRRLLHGNEVLTKPLSRKQNL
jgi:hypothetical protein